MLIPLLWWTILMLFWLLFITFAFWKSVHGASHRSKPYILRNDRIYGITGWYRVHQFLNVSDTLAEDELKEIFRPLNRIICVITPNIFGEHRSSCFMAQQVQTLTQLEHLN